MRQPKPWYRADKDCWYARVNGKRISLGVKGKAGRREAVAAWHKAVAGGPKAKAQVPKPPAQAVTVGGVVAGFLGDVAGRVKPKSLAWYRAMLEPFAQAHGTGPADGMTAAQAQQYASGQGWGQGTRHGFFGVLRMAFAWADRTGLIPANPLKGLKRPPMPSRGTDSVIPDATHERLTAQAPAHFKPFLSLLRETGARPSELARLTAQDVDLSHGVAVLSTHKTAAKTGRPRLIFLTPQAKATLQQLAQANPEGPLLRTRLGTGWTKDAVVLAFRRLSDKAGVKATAYGYRHTFATTALAAGVADAQVAALLGHSGTAMLHRHYSHLTAQAQAMREALGKVRN